MRNYNENDLNLLTEGATLLFRYAYNVGMFDCYHSDLFDHLTIPHHFKTKFCHDHMIAWCKATNSNGTDYFLKYFWAELDEENRFRVIKYISK